MITEATMTLILGTLASLIGGLILVGLSLLVSSLRRRKKGENYSDQLERLMKSLIQTSSEVDTILAELSGIVSARQAAMLDLESSLQALEERAEQIQLIEAVPLSSVGEDLKQLIGTGLRRNAKRDYAFFVLGVLVTSIITLLFGLISLV